MAWKVSLSPIAQKQLDDLDKPVANRIVRFLRERVEKLDDPRRIGERLQGTLSPFWRYRVGDYRIICSLEHDRLVVLVLRIGHRREIYSR
ncbi:MAG TPA: type II toxin-antitoxin system RelE/ParE family toxin [Candidatus Sulfotelmatobacter sp.]